jgi:restriction endonuclease S subunit
MEFIKLGDIVSIKKGKKPLFTESPNEKSIRVIQIDDLRNDNNIKYTDETSGVLVNEEDVLLAWDGANAGTVGFGKAGYIGSTIAVLKKKNPTDYSTIFIGKFLQRQLKYLRSKATGATIPHINRKSLDSLKLPVIDFAEQIRIAEILTQAEDIIIQRKESIVLLDQFLKSSFLEMFGDKIEKLSKLEYLGDNISYLTSGSRGWAKYYSESGAKFLRIQNIGGGIIRTDNLIFVNPPKSAETERTRVKEGDLIISITADLGRTSVIPKNFGEAYINQHLALIRLNENINPIYAAYFYNMPFGNNAIQKKNRSAVKAGLNFNDIKSLPIFIPKMTLQNQFASIVEKVEILKSEFQVNLKELENMYRVLSQIAFNGELKLKY